MILQNQPAENWQNSPLDTQNFLEQMLFNSFPGIKVNNIVPVFMKWQVCPLVPDGKNLYYGYYFQHPFIQGSELNFGLALSLIDGYKRLYFGRGGLVLFDHWINSTTWTADNHFIGYKITYDSVPIIQVPITTPSMPPTPAVNELYIYYSGGTNLDGKNYLQVKGTLSNGANKLRIKCAAIGLDHVCNNSEIVEISEPLTGTLEVTGHNSTFPNLNGIGESKFISGDVRNFDIDLTNGVKFKPGVDYPSPLFIGLYNASKTFIYGSDITISFSGTDWINIDLSSFPTAKYMAVNNPQYLGKLSSGFNFFYLVENKQPETVETVGKLVITRNANGEIVSIGSNSPGYFQVFKKQKYAGTWFDQMPITYLSSSGLIFDNLGGDTSWHYKIVEYDSIDGDTIIKQTVIDYVKI